MAESLNEQNFDDAEEFSIIDEQSLHEDLIAYSSNSENVSQLANSKNIFDEDIMVRSQYAKVVFYEVVNTYLTDVDIYCRYSLTNAVTPAPGDRIALFKVGWSSIKEELLHELAPMPSNPDQKYLHVIFKANCLPKDTSKFYQFCYINKDGNICGTSISFQFRTPADAELCEVDLPEGITEIRSHTSILESKLGILMQEKEKSDQIKNQLQNDLGKLQNDLDEMNKNWQKEITKVSRVLSENMDLNNQLNEKNKAILLLEEEKQNLLLQISDMKITIESLEQLKKIQPLHHKMDQRLKDELENLEQMNKILIDDKKLAIQELQTEMTKSNKFLKEKNEVEMKNADLEKQKKELIECNILLKKEVENMRKRCDELRKINSLETSQQFEIVRLQNESHSKMNPQLNEQSQSVIEFQARQLLDKDARLHSIELRVDFLSEQLEKNETALVKVTLENEQLTKDNAALVKKIKDLESAQMMAGPSLNQAICRLNADISSLKQKLSDTRDLITQHHESRVAASRSRREVLDKINSLREERKELQIDYNNHENKINLLRKELERMQADMNTRTFTAEEEEKSDKVLMDRMAKLTESETILEKVSTEMLKSLELEENLVHEELVWEHNIEKATLDGSVARVTESALSKRVEEMTDQIKQLQALPEFGESCLNSTGSYPNSDQLVSTLRDRLNQAAEEYQKVFLEKERLAKRLERITNKQKKTTPLSSSQQSSSTTSEEKDEATSSSIKASQNVQETFGLVNLDYSTSEKHESSDSAIKQSICKCPLCSESFPIGAPDLFRLHYENHLS